MNQSELKVYKYLLQAINAEKRDAKKINTGFGLTSHWLIKWREVF